MSSRNCNSRIIPYTGITAPYTFDLDYDYIIYDYIIIIKNTDCNECSGNIIDYRPYTEKPDKEVFSFIHNS